MQVRESSASGDRRCTSAGKVRDTEAGWEYPLAMTLLVNAPNAAPPFWPVFFLYLKYSFEGLHASPKMLFVTLILLGNLAASVVLKWPFRSSRWKKEYWLVFTNFLSIPAILAIAVIWAVDTSHVPRGPHIPVAWTVNGIFIISILFGIYSIYRMKNVRWLASSLVLIALWVLLWAGFIATMALSGDWI